MVSVKNIFNALSDNKTTSEISLFDTIAARQLNKQQRARVKQAVGEFLIEKTLQALAGRSTPVEGASYESKLTNKEYKKKKQEQGLSGVADLTLKGDMLDSLTFKNTEAGVEIGHFNKKQGLKADGHNNFSGQSTLPSRQYLPDVAKGYKTNINNEIRNIIAQEVGKSTKNIPTEALKQATTELSFWNTILATFPGFSRPEAKRAIMLNEDFYNFLKVEGLLKWLK